MGEKIRGKLGLGFVGMFLVITCIVFSRLLVVECLRLNGAYSLQKVLVCIDHLFDAEGSAVFSKRRGGKPSSFIPTPLPITTCMAS